MRLTICDLKWKMNQTHTHTSLQWFKYDKTVHTKLKIRVIWVSNEVDIVHYMDVPKNDYCLGNKYMHRWRPDETQNNANTFIAINQ